MEACGVIADIKLGDERIEPHAGSIADRKRSSHLPPR